MSFFIARCMFLRSVLFPVITHRQCQGRRDALWLVLKSEFFHLLLHYREISFTQELGKLSIGFEGHCFFIQVLAGQIMSKKKSGNLDSKMFHLQFFWVVSFLLVWDKFLSKAKSDPLTPQAPAPPTLQLLPKSTLCTEGAICSSHVGLQHP